MIKKLVCIVLLFGAIFFAWWWAGGVCEVVSKGHRRFEALIALFTALAFAGVIISLIIQSVQFKDSMVLQHKAADSAERAAAANLKSAEVAERNVLVQKEIASRQEELTLRQLRSQYLIVHIEQISKINDIVAAQPDLVPYFAESIPQYTSKLNECVTELESLTAKISRRE